MASYQEAIAEAFATAKSDVAILDTLEIRHPSISLTGLTTQESIFLVRDFDDKWMTLETDETKLFTAAGFQIKLPNRNDKGVQDLNFSIDNTDLLVSDFFQRTLDFPNEHVELVYRPYLSNDLSQPQMDPPLILYVSSVQISVSGVSGTATFADILNKAFPSNNYTKTRFPAL